MFVAFPVEAGKVEPRRTPGHCVVSVESVWASCGWDVPDALHVNDGVRKFCADCVRRKWYSSIKTWLAFVICNHFVSARCKSLRHDADVELVVPVHVWPDGGSKRRYCISM